MKSSIPPNRWKQLILFLLEITIFLALWFMLNMGIFSGYFAIFLIIALVVVVYFSFRNHAE